MMTSTRTGALVLSAWLAVLAGCTSTKSGVPAETSASSSEEKAAGEEAPGRSDVAEVRLITAQTPAVRAYRKIGSGAIYKAYPTRIHKGKIPPLVYAVVVVETDIDATGKVVNVGFSRTPSHAPEVPPMIAELIRKASPLPSPGRLGAHTYVDTWLWDKSGTFQLDSRTLGQRSR
jgi:periplasmic protein TonB